MKLIPDFYRREGIDCKLRFRDGKFAVYDCSSNGMPRSIELVIVRTRPERTLNGRVLEACERLPCNEDWGRYGWTFPVDARGEARIPQKIAELVSRPSRADKSLRVPKCEGAATPS